VEVRRASWQKHLELERLSEFRALPWRPIGPAFQGGRIEALAVHPKRPDTWFLGPGVGGVWKTTNAGVTWTPVFEHQPTFSIGDIAIAPSNPDIVWVGTGEVLMARSSIAGFGVFKSVDGGSKWQSMGLEATHHIGKILIHPRNPDVVLVAAIGRNYGPNPERGVYRTTDGGRSWKRTLFVDDRTGAIDLAMHPDDPRRLFAVMWEHDRRAWNHVSAGPGSGLFRSNDGGESWERVTKGLPAGAHVGRMSVAFAPSRPQVVYVLVSNETPLPPQAASAAGGALPHEQVRTLTPQAFVALEDSAIEGLLRSAGLASRYEVNDVRRSVESGRMTPAALADWIQRAAPSRSRTVGGELYRSDDSGATWRRVNDGPIGTAVGYDFCIVEVSPDNPDEVYVLGNWLRRSQDGGRNWTTVGGTIVHLRPHGGRILHLDHHEMVIDPENGNRILLGTDGGLYTSADRGGSWLHVNNLPIAEFYAIAADDRTPYRVYGGTQDNGALFGTAEPFRMYVPENWEHVYLDSWAGGDSYFTLPDPVESEIVYFEHQFGDIRRKNMRTGATSRIQPQPEIGEPPLRYNWMTPFVISHFNRHTLYYGANRLFRSVDRGDHWTPISGDLTTNPGPDRQGNVPFGTITSISESPLEPGLLVIGTDDGKVQYTADDGRTWSDISAGLPGKWVSRVVASAHDADTFYVTLTGYREDDVRAYAFRSTDRGRTWTSLVANLPAESVNVIREDPRHRELLYLGTELGVYVSLDSGRRWQSLGATLPTAAVHDLAVVSSAGQLVIGTHGLSAFVLDAQPIRQMTERIRGSALHVFAPRSATLRRHPGDSEPVPQDGPGEAPLHFYLQSPGPVSVHISRIGGAWARRIHVTGVAGVNEVLWDLRVTTSSSGEGGTLRDAPAGSYRVVVESAGARAETTLGLAERR
jgi:photosystem II stability/assembly factor-like uncharacterized protein